MSTLEAQPEPSSAVLFLASAGAGAALVGLVSTVVMWPEGCDAMVKQFQSSSVMTRLFGKDAKVVRVARACVRGGRNERAAVVVLGRHS
jgi:hypothetical protein